MKNTINRIISNNVCIWSARIVVALIIVFALNIKMDFIECDVAYYSLIGKIMMQFSCAFSSIGMGEFLEIGAMISIICYSNKKNIVHSWRIILFSVTLSVIYVCCWSFKKYNGFDLIFANEVQLVWFAFIVIGYSMFLYYIIRLLYYFFDVISETQDNNDFINPNKMFFISCVSLFLLLFPWSIMNYPGSFNPDSTLQIMQFFGAAELSNHHPILSTAIIGGLTWLGKSIISVNFGIYLYVFLQMAALILVVSYGIKKVTEWGMSKYICYAIIAFFGVVPIWGSHVQWIEKSLLFGTLAAYSYIEVLDIVKTKEITKKRLIIVLIVMTLACYLRNDGKYLVLPCGYIIALNLKKNYKKLMLLSMVAVTLAAIIPIKLVFMYSNINEGSIKEALSIPFMQTARYVVAYDSEVTEEERNAINNVLEYDSLASLYNPILSDGVKETYKGDETKLPKYFSVWLKMFLKHPNVYITALINKCYGYLAPVESIQDANFDYGQSGYIEEIGVRHLTKEFPQRFFNMLHMGVENWPIFRYFAMCGTYTWVVVCCIGYVCNKRKYKDIIVFVPAIINLLICIASPCHNLLRYYITTVIIAPFLVAWICRKNESEVIRQN